MQAAMRQVSATYHEGCGNDFLVVVDLDAELSPSIEDVQRICARRDQQGADGFMVIRRGTSSDLAMQLWNADGSIAEMSGNGIRCLAQAAYLSSLTQSLVMTIATGAGVRTVTYVAGNTDRSGTAFVTMGPVTLLEEVELQGVAFARRASVGNPHLVMVVDQASDVDPMLLGPQLSTARDEGTNVEWISPRSRHELDFVVYERGVGPTKACGTGSCAAAVVAHVAGLVDQEVLVHNPGGTLTVNCRDQDDVVLSGPVNWIDTISVSVGTSA